MKKPVIGLMLGDATGIGPEISARLLASGAAGEVANVVVIGDRRVLELGMRDAGVELGTDAWLQHAATATVAIGPVAHVMSLTVASLHAWG